MAGDPPQFPRWSALLMAGGESRRMGRDKALLEIAGEPLWRRQWRTLREAGFAEIMIARGEREPLGSGEPGLVGVSDAQRACGPFGGLTGALRQATTDWLLVLAIDLPLMPARFLREMMAQAEVENRGLIPIVGGHYEPLAAIYLRLATLALAEEFLLREEFSLQTLVKRGIELGHLRPLEVAEANRKFFRNVNTPEDLTEAGNLITHPHGLVGGATKG